MEQTLDVGLEHPLEVIVTEGNRGRLQTNATHPRLGDTTSGWCGNRKGSAGAAAEGNLPQTADKTSLASHALQVESPSRPTRDRLPFWLGSQQD